MNNFKRKGQRIPDFIEKFREFHPGSISNKIEQSFFFKDCMMCLWTVHEVAGC